MVLNSIKCGFRDNNHYMKQCPKFEDDAYEIPRASSIAVQKLHFLP